MLVQLPLLFHFSNTNSLISLVFPRIWASLISIILRYLCSYKLDVNLMCPCCCEPYSFSVRFRLISCNIMHENRLSILSFIVSYFKWCDINQWYFKFDCCQIRHVEAFVICHWLIKIAQRLCSNFPRELMQCCEVILLQWYKIR